MNGRTTKLPQVGGYRPPRIGVVGYAAEEVFSPVDIDLWGWAEHYVSSVPSRQLDGEYVRCHEIARAVGQLLDLPVVDGTYGLSMQHSWLELTRQHGRDRAAIIDIYAPGRLPRVQLVDPFFLLPEGKLYKPGAPRADIREDVVRWLILLMENWHHGPR